MQRVNLVLDGDEALVLYDWIRALNARDDVEFKDQAEQRVLWDIESLLERELVAPFADNYRELLAEARSRVRDAE